MDDSLAPDRILRCPESLQRLVATVAADPAVLVRLQRVNWVALAVDLPSISSSLSSLVDCVLSTSQFPLLESVLRLLISNLKDVELCRPQAPLRLAGRTFDSATELKKEIYGILRAHSFGQDLQGCEQGLLMELFRHHPRAQQKLTEVLGVTVGTHKEGDLETRCFCIKTTQGLEEISYLKSVTALANRQSQEEDESLLEKLQSAALVSIDLLLSVLEENPLLHGTAVKLLISAFPHMRHELHVQKFYVTNLMAICSKDRSFEQALVRLTIGKIVRIDAEGDLNTADTLLEVVLRYIQLHLSDSLFHTLLDAFEELVLPTFHTSCVQIAILFCCQEGRAEYLETFASLLIHCLSASQHVRAAAAYLTSLLAMFDAHILLPAVDKLLQICLKMPNGAHFVTSAKYVLYLLAMRPGLLNHKKIESRAKRLLKSRTRFLESVPLHPGIDYSPILALLPNESEFVTEELYLPFDLTLSEVPLCQQYLRKTYVVEDFVTRRRRGMSLDVSEPSSLKRRLEESCASSLDTSTPTRSL